MPSESFEINIEKLKKIMGESFSKDVMTEGMWSITSYRFGDRFLIDIVFDDWIGVHLSDFNRFADNLCTERIIQKASKNFWIFDAHREKRDYGSLGIMIDVSNTWKRSLKPRPKSKPTELKPKDEPVVFVDEKGLGISREEKIKRIIEKRLSDA